ncbi:MAG: sigma-70 family RNA polymerase sigma factor [Deltaproteobacteria bacterium]|nr:sigma-70 family RNA polymerase sigma factor [Deltaproteobacteria bacterium]
MRAFADPEIVLGLGGVALQRVAAREPHSAASPQPLGDLALCELALQGDGVAWNELIRRHDRRVVVALLARGIGLEKARDIAQETWLRLVQQQREGKLETLRLPGLAITQATFLALELARRDATATRLLGEGHAQDAVHHADAETHMLAEERIASARKVLERCSSSGRQVFQLVYGPRAMSHADVARQLGLSLQRVRQILCEVRKAMREAVDGADDA